jgi:hypothetical protein
MTLGVYDKASWNFDSNRVLGAVNYDTQAKRFLWYLASFLTGNTGGMVTGLWTLFGSSNSSTWGLDTTDRWALAGPFDATKIVGAAAGSAHSWIVLKSPIVNGIAYYLILDFLASNKCKSWISKTVPTGGSTTARPTAITSPATEANEVSGTLTVSSGGTPLAESTVSSVDTVYIRLHGGLASDGSCYIAMCVNGCPPRFGFFFNLMYPSSLKTGDTWRAVMYLGGASNGGYYTQTNNIQDMGSAFGQRQVNTASQMLTPFFTGSCASRRQNTSMYTLNIGSAIDSGHALAPAAVLHSSASGTEIPHTYPANILYITDNVDFSAWASLLHVYSGSTTIAYSHKGRLEDIYNAPEYTTESHMTSIHGAVLTSGGTVRFAKLGAMWLPASTALYW